MEKKSVQGLNLGTVNLIYKNGDKTLTTSHKSLLLGIYRLFSKVLTDYEIW